MSIQVNSDSIVYPNGLTVSLALLTEFFLGITNNGGLLQLDGISVSDQKFGVYDLTISTDQQELNLQTFALADGWNGHDLLNVTIDTGVYIWSDDITIPALTTGNIPNGLIIYTDGYIMGKGGTGGNYNAAGSDGGPAISLDVATYIIGGPNAYIGGGGGGGGGSTNSNNRASGGGGAGGGNSGNAGNGSIGLGGAIGSSGTDGGTAGTNPGLAGLGGTAGGTGAAG